MLALTKTAETSSTITFSWKPPSGAEWYLFYRGSVRVSNAAAVDSHGVVKNSIRFSKGPEPYQVVCVTRHGLAFGVEVGSYVTPPPLQPNQGLSAPTAVVTA